MPLKLLENSFRPQDHLCLCLDGASLHAREHGEKRQYKRKIERSSAFPQMLEEEKVEGRRRDGDFDGTHRPQSGVKGFENE